MGGTFCIMPYSPYDDRINNPLETENPYSFQEYIDNDGWLIGTINWLFGEITGRNKENEVNRMSSANQEDAQQHDFDMARYQQEMHEQNLINDPRLMMQGYQNAGISANAAAQAVLGSQSTFAPSGSSVGSQGASMSPSLLPSLLQTLVDLPLKQAQTENLGALTEGQEIDNAYKPIVTQTMIDESQGRLYKMQHDMNLDDRQIAVTEALANSTLGLNEADLKLKEEELNKMHEDINKLVVETDLLKKYSSHELIKMSLTRSEIGKTIQDTATSAAQEGLYRQETDTSASQEALNYQGVDESIAREGLINRQQVGQQYENDIKNVERRMKNYRLQCSKILGVEVDAPETTQYLESLLTGQDAYISKAFEITKSGYLNDLKRYMNTVTGGIKRQKSIRRISSDRDLQPTWNP